MDRRLVMACKLVIDCKLSRVDPAGDARDAGDHHEVRKTSGHPQQESADPEKLHLERPVGEDAEHSAGHNGGSNRADQGCGLLSALPDALAASEQGLHVRGDGRVWEPWSVTGFRQAAQE
jgi:hypothetical protein